MILDILDLFELIKDMKKDIDNRNYSEFNMYIDDVFDKCQNVLENYFDIFSTIRQKVLMREWDAKDVLVYISSVEYEYKAIRIYLRNIKGYRMLSDREKGENDYKNFMNSVTHILSCKTGDGNTTHTLYNFCEKCRKVIEDEEDVMEIYYDSSNILINLEISWRNVCYYYNQIKSKKILP